MKKYLKILGVAVIIGGVIAYFFYYDINKEVRAISKKEEIVTLFQTGVFKDYNNATSFAATFPSSYVYKDSEYYRVIIAVCYHKETKLKLETIFNSEEIEYYEKEIAYIPRTDSPRTACRVLYLRPSGRLPARPAGGAYRHRR